MALKLAGCVYGAAGRSIVTANITQAAKIVPVSLISGGYESRRGYAMRLELTEHGIKWRRPEYIPSWRPEKSGDLRPRQPPSPDRLRLDVAPAASHLEKVDDLTRQLLTLRFSNRKEQKQVELYDVLRKIQRHQYDKTSLEVKIAKKTVMIRNLQDQASLFQRNRGKGERIKLQEAIDKRKKLLKILRGVDYKRFEWLIEELGILYRPSPQKYSQITRKGSLRKLVDLHGKEIREKRMDEYRATLDKQKAAFLEEKKDTLKWIAETESSLGLPVSVSQPEKTEDSEDQKDEVKS